MTNFERLIEGITPERLAGIMMCPGELGGDAVDCAARGAEKCRVCKEKWLSIHVGIEEDRGKPKKHKYGQYENVLLSDDELEKLKADYGKEAANRAIEYLSEYMAYKAYRVRSHYLALRKWVFTALKEQDIKADRLSVDAARAERAKRTEEEKQKAEREDGRLDFELEDLFEKVSGQGC